MGPTNHDLLYQEWQWLVRECASAVGVARSKGLTGQEMEIEQGRYALRIDAVYARLKQAETRSVRESRL